MKTMTMTMKMNMMMMMRFDCNSIFFLLFAAMSCFLVRTALTTLGESHDVHYTVIGEPIFLVSAASNLLLGSFA